jgi:hypothetical protein
MCYDFGLLWITANCTIHWWPTMDWWDTVAIMESLSVTAQSSKDYFLSQWDWWETSSTINADRAQSLSSQPCTCNRDWCRRSFSKTSSQSQSLLRTLCTKRQMENQFHTLHFLKMLQEDSRLSRWNAIVEARENTVRNWNGNYRGRIDCQNGWSIASFDKGCTEDCGRTRFDLSLVVAIVAMDAHLEFPLD